MEELPKSEHPSSQQPAFPTHAPRMSSMVVLGKAVYRGENVRGLCDPEQVPSFSEAQVTRL